MHQGFDALSTREKDTLRLLLNGHDAKSIARNLDLSVHTVNERLREARRKLGVSSSREAARRLAEAERLGHDFLADKQLRVGGVAAAVTEDEHPSRRWGAGASLAWLGGGMLIMSLIIAAVALSSAFHANSDPRASPAIMTASTASDRVGLKSALAWLALVDDRHWDKSWDAAGALFKSAIQKAPWASTIQSVKEPLGPVSSRSLQTDTRTNSLPGVPVGEYEVLQFQTNFARKPNAVETIFLAREGSSWKVVGYFIR